MGNKLLKKDIVRVETPKPNNTVKRDYFSDAKEVDVKKKNKEPITTIRCTVDICNTINALSVLFGFDAANDFLVYSTEKVLSELSIDQKKEYESIKKVSSKRRRVNK